MARKRRAKRKTAKKKTFGQRGKGFVAEGQKCAAGYVLEIKKRKGKTKDPVTGRVRNKLPMRICKQSAQAKRRAIKRGTYLVVAS